MKHKLLMTLAGGLLLAGCTADRQDGPDGQDGRVPVRLCVGLDAGDGFTRTATDLHSATSGFAEGEQMTVFMKDGETTTGKTYQVQSVSSGTATLTSSAPLYYPMSNEGSVSLYAVYPAGVTTTSGHTVAYDQTTDAAYQASDLMYSPAKEVSLANKGDVQALNAFAHQMVRLKLTVVKGAGISSVTQVKMNNVKRAVSVTTLDETGITLGAAATATGETAEQGNNADEILISSGMTAASETYYVVFPKQVAEGNDWNAADFITVTAGGADITYNLTKAFTAGRQYNLTLTLTAATLGTTVTIDDWAEGDTWEVINEGTASFHIPPILLADATADHIGYLICTSGHIHAYGQDASCTAARVAMIAYVGSATGEAAPYNHGLAIAMADCGNGSTYQWKTDNISPGHSYIAPLPYNSSAFASEGGLQYRSVHNSSTYPAFQAAFSNNDTPSPTNCSDWFLATGYQWKQMIDAKGHEYLRYAFSSRGGTDMESGRYWNSTERNTGNTNDGAAYCCYFNNYWDSANFTDYKLVRATLAF